MDQELLSKTWKASEFTKDFPMARTLGELIEAASSRYSIEGQVICAVRVNGLKLNESQEIQFGPTPLKDISEFSIQTQDLELLLDESLKGCADFLGQLTESITHASDLFRIQDVAPAHRFYQKCIESTELFVEMLNHHKTASLNVRGTCPSTWGPFGTQLADIMRDILEAYRQKNYILVADLLEFELGPHLIRWQKDLYRSYQGDTIFREPPNPQSTESSNC